MIALGRIIPGIHVPFGRVPLAIGTAGPAPEVMATSNEAVRKLLLDANSIAYIAAGTSGKTFLRALDIMGLHDQDPRSLAPHGAGRTADRRGEKEKCSTPLHRYRGSSPRPASRRSRPFRRNWD